MSNQVYSNDITQYSINVNNINTKSIQFNGGSLFQSYTHAGYASSVTGPITASAGALYRKIDRTYIISCEGMTGTSTLSAPITFTNLLTHAPFSNMTYPIWIKDNGVDSIGTLKIDTSGQMKIYKNLNDNFSATGICGFQPFCVAFCTYG